MKKKKLITVAIDSPAAAGAGTQAKLIAKHYNLLHLDTGRIYRFIGLIKITSPKKYNDMQLTLFSDFCRIEVSHKQNRILYR